jgi:hypothetical protein
MRMAQIMAALRSLKPTTKVIEGWKAAGKTSPGTGDDDDDDAGDADDAGVTDHVAYKASLEAAIGPIRNAYNEADALLQLVADLNKSDPSNFREKAVEMLKASGY